jgi:translation initiation factor 3 subunit F
MATPLPALNLALPASLTTPALTVNPTVLLTVLDHYLRRKNDNNFVIGTLLGTRSDDGRNILVTNAFPVPYDANKKGSLNMDYHRNMYNLHQRVNQKEVVVGWYATGKELIPNAAEIQQLYREECANPPVHLLLDTELTNDSLGLKAFYTAPIGLAAKPERSLFVPAPCKVEANQAENCGLDVLAQARGKEDRTASLASDLESLERSIRKVQQLLDRAIEYVESVLEGKQPMDATVGRRLMDAVSAVPKLDEAAFESAFNEHLQDQLMVIYLTNLTRAQVNIAESIQSLP